MVECGVAEASLNFHGAGRAARSDVALGAMAAPPNLLHCSLSTALAYSNMQALGLLPLTVRLPSTPCGVEGRGLVYSLLVYQL